jgi:hypothetical protein
MADSSVQASGAAAKARMAQAAGAGYAGTLVTSSQGAASPATGQNRLLGQ